VLRNRLLGAHIRSHQPADDLVGAATIAARSKKEEGCLCGGTGSRKFNGRFISARHNMARWRQVVAAEATASGRATNAMAA